MSTALLDVNGWSRCMIRLTRITKTAHPVVGPQPEAWLGHLSGSP